MVKLIVDGNGRDARLKNTAFLEGSFGGCSVSRAEECSRCDYVDWREIRLNRGASPRDRRAIPVSLLQLPEASSVHREAS